MRYILRYSIIHTLHSYDSKSDWQKLKNGEFYNYTIHLVHKTDNEIKMIDEMYYSPYKDMIANMPMAEQSIRPNTYNNDNTYLVFSGMVGVHTHHTQPLNGSYAAYYLNGLVHHLYDITTDVPKKIKRGGGGAVKQFSDKPCACVTDTREHLENWKYFVYNNKLPLFIVIVILDGLNNTVMPYVPWLVDKHYTDEEISEMFGFTQEEIDFIDYVLKKYERHSPWFKRFMCGEDSVTNEEINNYILKIKNKEL